MMHWITGLKHNWGMKLFCLFCAIGMWVFVMKDQNPVIEMTYTVPVQVQNLDQGKCSHQFYSPNRDFHR